VGAECGRPPFYVMDGASLESAALAAAELGLRNAEVRAKPALRPALALAKRLEDPDDRAPFQAPILQVAVLSQAYRQLIRLGHW
jgi:hypothetical protein